MTKSKKILLGVVLVIALLVGIVAIIISRVQGPPVETGKTALKYREIPFPFTQTGDLDKSLPFMGMATVDSDGDGVDEIVVGGGIGQADAIFTYAKDGFVASPMTGLKKDATDTTYGIASADINGDGPEELFICRESGLYLAENTAGSYQQRKIEFGIDKSTTPLSVALGDINRDGFVDLYVSGYIKLEYAEGETNFSDGYGAILTFY